MNHPLVWTAGLLVVAWLVAVTTLKIVSVAVHGLIGLAAVLILVWAVRKFTGHGGDAAR